MRSRGFVAGITAAAALLAVAVTMLRRFEIVDASMEPTLRHGDWVLAWRRLRPPVPGDVVVFRTEELPNMWLVKRVVENRPEGAVVHGDNLTMSTGDSRSLGPIPHRAIAWRVLGRYWPWERIGGL